MGPRKPSMKLAVALGLVVGFIIASLITCLALSTREADDSCGKAARSGRSLISSMADAMQVSSEAQQVKAQGNEPRMAQLTEEVTLLSAKIDREFTEYGQAIEGCPAANETQG